jgi:hypothetical protein
MVVDGEHFDVTERTSERGVYELRWVSGPNDGYGFAACSHGSEPLSDEELEDAVRNFLSQVDRATGYIE